jgi:hypothetical protein
VDWRVKVPPAQDQICEFAPCAKAPRGQLNATVPGGLEMIEFDTTRLGACVTVPPVFVKVAWASATEAHKGTTARNASFLNIHLLPFDSRLNNYCQHIYIETCVLSIAHYETEFLFNIEHAAALCFRNFRPAGDFRQNRNIDNLNTFNILVRYLLCPSRK